MRTVHKFTESEVKEIIRNEKGIPLSEEIEIEKDTIPWGKLTTVNPPYTVTCTGAKTSCNSIPHCIWIRD